MQPLLERTKGSERPHGSVAHSARELSRSWDVLARFALNRKIQASLHQGADLTPAQLQALFVLSEGPARMGELAHGLGLAESSVTRLVDRLHRDGLVHRDVPEDNRRTVVVGLTGEGKRLVTRFQRERRSLMVEILKALDEVERDQLVGLFEKIATVLRRREAEAGRRAEEG
jgi:DNA-binding MarR family transcriptional regulator